MKFMYDKSSLDEVVSYKYLGIDIHNKFNWNYNRYCLNFK